MERLQTRFLSRAAVAVFCAAALFVSPTVAQERGKIGDLFGQGGSATDKLKPHGPKVQFSLLPGNAKAGDAVTLSIAVTVPKNGYTYSTSPKFSGGTRVKITEAAGLEPIDENFQPNHPPKTVFEPLFNQEVEKHFGDVTWSRKYRVRPDADPQRIAVKGNLHYQVCDDRSCTPYRLAMNVRLGQTAAASEEARPSSPGAPQPSIVAHPFEFSASPEVRGHGKPATVRVQLSPENAKPGQEVTLSATLRVEAPWHSYSMTQDPKQAALPTKIETPALNGLRPIDDKWTANRPHEVKETRVEKDTYRQEVYEGEVTWTKRFVVEPSAAETGYGAAGSVRYQLCDPRSCLPPATVKFSVGMIAAVDASTLSPTSGDADGIIITDAPAATSLGWYIFYAFLGGMILNVMPCVLPVIAIKVMSFVQQAGESRSRIFLLNATYALGVIAVFLVLASLAVLPSIGLGWGGLFRSSGFNLVMACVIFAMGLSLLGVFEIPVPGMIGSAAGAHNQEGLTGAFLTGVLATLLATPCSGPFMGTTLAWSVQQQPSTTYLVWGVMGLGMASPYLVFALFPGAIKWLPRPGNWMIRLKEFAGFVLMGTVIFFIYFLEKAYTIPLLIMLLGIALGLWMIGSLYDHSTPHRHKNLVRISALILTTAICGFGYSMTRVGDETRLPWEHFSESRLAELRQQGRNVLIDFTADWCLVCKANEEFALNTKETLELVQKHNFVTLSADYTYESPEIDAWLKKFESISVPLTVIFPANRPNQPIIIRDAYTKRTLLQKLNEAVALKGNASLPMDEKDGVTRALRQPAVVGSLTADSEID
ncbi:MAG: thioredoxin family protein [Planctomycetaceae bacterium]